MCTFCLIYFFFSFLFDLFSNLFKLNFFKCILAKEHYLEMQLEKKIIICSFFLNSFFSLVKIFLK